MNWFKNISIAKKLYFVSALVAILVLVELGTIFYVSNGVSNLEAWEKKTIFKLLPALSLTVGFIGLALTFMVVKGITNALGEILHASRRIAQNDFSVKAQVYSNDELGVLANTFNGMAADLFKSIQKRSETEQKLNDAQRVANIGNWEWDIIKKTIEWSEGLYRIYGVSRGNFEANYENYLASIHPDDREYVNGVVQKAYQDHQPFDFFHRIILPHGEERTIHGRGEVYLDNEGKITRMIGTAHDVSELKNVERKLNEYNKELALINEDLALKTNFIQENEKRIIGIMDALIKITQLDFSDKLSISERGDELDAIAVGLNTMSEELEFHLQQLKESEDKLKEAQRLAKIGSWTMDFATQKVQWSDEMFNIYGYGSERFSVNYEKAMDRILPEDAENARVRMKQNIETAVRLFKENAIRETEILPSTFTILLDNDRRKVVQGRGKLLLDANGELLKMVGTVQDIDEQYKAEQKLNEYNIELERKNKEIQQFAYAASHDLQEPLRSISNFSKLLAERLADHGDKEMNEYISLVSGGASRMSKLIFSLLEYSRIGKDMQKHATDCDQLVNEIQADLASIVEESGALIHVEKLPLIQSYDLKSVFQNLIINAIKFKKKDIAPIVNISATDLGKEFLFIIKDNGIGIEKQYYDRIFVIFQRLHLRTEYDGTGIGLSLTRKIIEMHGGKIWVESEPGKGSTFYFTIPKS